MKSDELMLKIENVSKVYRLGEIGGTTLRDELQRLKAKVFRKEDPTKKIGAKDYNKGEKFKALNNISFEVKTGERIGIIGHNGAGKSTLLKLISRVTGPTDGKIYLNGRVASMLEVGTGFHPELTGRENIYMNGAILGMTKKEIDAKMEDIIEFSEVRQFIDTPVKRYSSGMYVKLAFSVAAHLDSEIVIMDEVLAVGDVAFQKKCISKMKSISEQFDKTILYVSHNMSTIRELCNRVIVLDKGECVFDGDVDKGIEKYLGVKNNNNKFMNFEKRSYDPYISGNLKILSLNVLNDSTNLNFGESLRISLRFNSKIKSDELIFRFTFYNYSGIMLSTAYSDKVVIKYPGCYESIFAINLNNMAPGEYAMKIVVLEFTHNGNQVRHDCIENALFFSVIDSYSQFNMIWNREAWGYFALPDVKIENE